MQNFLLLAWGDVSLGPRVWMFCKIELHHLPNVHVAMHVQNHSGKVQHALPLYVPHWCKGVEEQQADLPNFPEQGHVDWGKAGRIQ